MSIVLPVDYPTHHDTLRKQRMSRRRNPMLLGLRDIPLWRILTSDITPPLSKDPKSPTGKLKLVTSKWVDSPRSKK
ncbi:MAG TPA: hypothetical protein ENN67_09110 [Firmicutes bacterium]|nr:hypothetical protein [Bacillota bacterium]